MSRRRPSLPLFAALLAAAVACGPAPRRTAEVGAARVDEVQAESNLADRLEKHVLFLAELDPPRSEQHPESLMRAAAYIAARLEAAGGEVEFQDYEVEGRSYRNVSAFLGPETPDRIVVGAHYDVCMNLPGADDNGSGVAGLLELCRGLSEAELETRVELMAYTLEEPPHFAGPDMGSARHASRLKEQGALVRGMVCLEMIGYFSDEPDSQRYPIEAMGELYPSTGNFIAVVGRPEDSELISLVHDAMDGASDLPVEQLAAPRMVPGVAFSDHRSYWAAGYSAVMITDTADYRNANYHTDGDLPDTLDYERMAKVVEGALAAVLGLGER